MRTARRAKIPSACESLVDESFHSQPDDPEDMKFLAKAGRLHHRQVGLMIPRLAAARRPCCVGIIRPVGKLPLTTLTPLCSYFCVLVRIPSLISRKTSSLNPLNANEFILR